jgi:hypothetical protein
MKQFLMLLTVFCLIGWGSSAAAEESEEDIILKYRMAGIKDAKTVEEAFVFLEKPKFQTAYDDYVRDLDVIRKTGRAPDNEGLFQDLRKMNSNEFFVYTRNRPSKNKIINPMFRRY